MLWMNISSVLFPLDVTLGMKTIFHCRKSIQNYKNAKQLILQLRCYRELKEVRRLYKSISSLGSGNHFIELDKDESGLTYR